MNKVSSDINVHYRMNVSIGAKEYLDQIFKDNTSPRRLLSLVLERLTIKVHGMITPTQNKISARGSDMEGLMVLSYVIRNWGKVLKLALKERR